MLAMMKKLSKNIGEYKKQTILTPVFVALEVIFDVLIPFIMSKLLDVIDKAANPGVAPVENPINKILGYGGLLVLFALVALYFGAMSGRMAAISSAGFAKNLRKNMFYSLQDYSFNNIDKFSSFEGKTGPYIQYTGARINSLLSKAEMTDKFDWLSNLNLIDIADENQRTIAINFLKLQESYYTSYKDNSLNSLCLALFDFASSFSKFYNDTRILTEKDEVKKNSYLALCLFVLRAIKQASNVLAFEIPEKM